MSRLLGLVALACLIVGCSEGAGSPARIQSALVSGAVPNPDTAPISNPIPAGPIANAQTYVNPLQIALPDGTFMESCPDPSIIHGQTPGDQYWYMYCTNEIFHDNSPLHLLPISVSADLVNWRYAGDIFQQTPPWVAGDGGLWAPDIEYFNGLYYVYYAVSDTTLSGGGSAVFVEAD